MKNWLGRFILLLVLLVAVGCGEEEVATRPLTLAPTATAVDVSTPVAVETPLRPEDIDFITIVTDAPNPPFADFNLMAIDAFGNLTGFDADVMAAIANHLDWEYEFIVTSYEGMLESVADGEFDAAMSALTVTSPPPVAGIVYTDPYLEVGQVLVVRANERDLQSHDGIQPGTAIGVQTFSQGEATALEVVGVDDADLVRFDRTPAALQALIDGVVDGVIIDHDDAERYANEYWQQLKIVGGSGREAWIASRSYGIAVAEDNVALLEMLNEAIASTTSLQTEARQEWLVAQTPINAGESLIGTPADQIVIGAIGGTLNLDPVSAPDLLSWELMINTLSGLLMVDTSNNLVPVVAEDFPLVSEDKLEYIFTLREGLTFPDGSALTAEDVEWSIERAASNGFAVVNGILKDANGDGFADDDAVVVLNPLQMRFVLQEPASYFLDLLATPPYFVINSECYLVTAEPARNCPGLGQYTVTDLIPNEKVDLTANPDWPGEPPQFNQIQIRLYTNTAGMRNSLENSAIDIAWTGLTESDLSEMQDDTGFRYWTGPFSFKSYLVFEQSQPPWDDERIRQAAAYAVDREALAAVFDGQREPLYSPVPDTTPGHRASLPQRDLEEARALLAQAGYTPTNPLAITIWYINDGRYSIREEQYAQALERQLEETDVFQVTLENAAWETYRVQMSRCSYPAFLLGWPTPGQPPRSLDVTSWIHYFVTNTSTLCSNYESETMDQLITEALAVNPLLTSDLRQAYNEIQDLWAVEYPTLDLTQASRIAVSLTNVNGVDEAIDAMGLLHYGMLSKGRE